MAGVYRGQGLPWSRVAVMGVPWGASAPGAIAARHARSEARALWVAGAAFNPSNRGVPRWT